MLLNIATINPTVYVAVWMIEESELLPLIQDLKTRRAFLLLTLLTQNKRCPQTISRINILDWDFNSLLKIQFDFLKTNLVFNHWLTGAYDLSLPGRILLSKAESLWGLMNPCHPSFTSPKVIRWSAPLTLISSGKIKHYIHRPQVRKERKQRVKSFRLQIHCCCFQGQMVKERLSIWFHIPNKFL